MGGPILMALKGSSALDLHRIPEMNGVENRALLVFNVDAMVGDEMSLVLDCFRRREASIVQGDHARLIEVA